jgi:hypothetical protein
MHTYTHTCLTRGGSFLDYTLTASKRDKTNPHDNTFIISISEPNPHTKTFFIINVSATLKNQRYSFRPKNTEPAGRPTTPTSNVEKAKDPLISFEEERKRVWLPLRLNNFINSMQKTSYLSYFQIQIKGDGGGKKMPNPRNRNGKTQKEEKRKEVFS